MHNLVYYYSTELKKDTNSVELFRPFSDEKKVSYEAVNDGL